LTATGLFIKSDKGLRVVKLEATKDYQSKAYIVGRAWWDTNERSLNAQCFAKFASKGSDFTVYNTPN
jgi:hypothetical protein